MTEIQSQVFLERSVPLAKIPKRDRHERRKENIAQGTKSVTGG